MAQRHGAEVVDLDGGSEVADAIRDRTDGRGTDSVIDAVGMEAHGSPAAKLAQRVATVLPDVAGQKLMKTAGVDRLAALHLAIDAVRRGGTISLSGVYGGAADPLPMLTLFDKGVRLAMGQAHVRQWTDRLLPLATDDADPLGVLDLATHRLPLSAAPEAYEMFQHKRDGAIKVLLTP
jgi:threonine dehydrogenase-like Zn-dependent dehydrogenase